MFKWFKGLRKFEPTYFLHKAYISLHNFEGVKEVKGSQMKLKDITFYVGLCRNYVGFMYALKWKKSFIHRHFERFYVGMQAVS